MVALSILLLIGQTTVAVLGCRPPGPQEKKNPGQQQGQPGVW
jgi:hypothetical protein